MNIEKLLEWKRISDLKEKCTSDHTMCDRCNEQLYFCDCCKYLADVIILENYDLILDALKKDMG
jgi:hypothetical protein